MISFSLYFSRFLKNYDLRKNKAKNQSKLETNLILINFSRLFFAVFLVKFPKFFTKIKHVAVLWKKWFAKKQSEKSIKIGSNFDFNAFFASLFRFANLEKFLKRLQFFASGSPVFFIFRGGAKFRAREIYISLVKSNKNAVFVKFEPNRFGAPGRAR